MPRPVTFSFLKNTFNLYFYSRSRLHTSLLPSDHDRNHRNPAVTASLPLATSSLYSQFEAALNAVLLALCTGRSFAMKLANHGVATCRLFRSILYTWSSHPFGISRSGPDPVPKIKEPVLHMLVLHYTFSYKLCIVVFQIGETLLPVDAILCTSNFLPRRSIRCLTNTKGCKPCCASTAYWPWPVLYQCTQAKRPKLQLPIRRSVYFKYSGVIVWLVIHWEQIGGCLATVAYRLSSKF